MYPAGKKGHVQIAYCNIYRDSLLTNWGLDLYSIRTKRLYIVLKNEDPFFGSVCKLYCSSPSPIL